ncbi:uncharacterized protein LOC144872390 isoform X2 [Branchiostoma floridae x Branchiostoma japonicum]
MFNGKCYRFSTDKETFSSAQDTCGHDGGRLATIHGPETNAFIAQKVRDNMALDNVWIGLNDRREEGKFVWSDGMEASTGYTNWFPNEPNNFEGPGEDCVEIRPPWVQQNAPHMWNDRDCGAKLRFVCEKGTMQTKGFWGQIKHSCTAGYMLLHQKCYKLSTEKANFRDAQSVCEKEGGRLATIPNKYTNNYLLSKIRHLQGYKDGYWIGLNDIENEGTFVWSDGSTLQAYSDWIGRQPDNRIQRSDGEDCVIMRSEGTGEMWNDMGCEFKAHFVCEKEEMVDQDEHTISQLEQELQKRDETIQQLSQQQQHREEELMNMTEVNQQLMQQLEQKEEEIQDKSRIIGQLNLNLQVQETELTQRENALHEMTDRNQHLLQQLQQKDKELQNKTETINQQSHQLQELQPLVEQLRHKERELEETLMELERAQAYIYANEELSQQLQQKDDVLLNKTEIIQELTQQLAELLHEAEPSSGDLDLQADLQARDELIQEQAQHIASLQHQLEEEDQLTRLIQTLYLHDQPRTTVQTIPQPAQGTCGGRYETAPGTISSPGYPEKYPDNSDCTYTITAPPGQLIIITIQHFDLEESYDDLEMSEGGGTQHIEELTGTIGPGRQYVSNTNEIQLHFTSDHTLNLEGFSLSYIFHGAPLDEAATTATTATATCEGLYLDTNTITSPGYPAEYSDDEHCTYTIKAPPGHIVKIIFVDFDLEDPYDSLEVTNQPGENKTYTGSTTPRMYTSWTNEVQLQFTSDESLTRRGFNLTYGSYAADMTATIATATCDGLDEYNSIITSPGYQTDTSYPDNVKCNYTIKAHTGYLIEIIFEDFDLETDHDFLNISDFTSGTNLKSYTGSYYAGEVYTSKTNEVQLNFTSDHSNSESGFKLIYRSYANSDQEIGPGTTPSNLCDSLHNMYGNFLSPSALSMMRSLYNCPEQPSETTGAPSQVSTTPVPSGCPEGFVSHGQKCYWVSDMIENYRAAEGLCEGLSGRLAVIKDADTQQFLADYIRNTASQHSTSAYWIGLQNVMEGNFIWSDGSQLMATDYSSWAEGESDSHLEEEPCVHVWEHDDFTWWTDLECTMALNFVCELEKSDPEETSSANPTPTVTSTCEDMVHAYITQNQIIASPSVISGMLEYCQQLQSASTHWPSPSGDGSVQDETSATTPTTTVTNICEDLLVLASQNILPRDVVIDMLEYCPQLQSVAVPTTPAPTTPDKATVPPACPEGYLFHQQKCYWISKDVKINYSGAEELCEGLGGKLAVVKDAATQEFLADYIRENGECCKLHQMGYWIGLKDHNDNGNFIWSDGTTLTGYNNWQPGEPSNHFWSENCVHMYPRFDLKWNDQTCTTRMGCICEIASTVQETTPSPTTVKTTPAVESKCEDLVAYANGILQSPTVIQSISEDCLQLQSEEERTLTCPESYSLHNQVCYKASTTSAPYHRAEEACAEDTASLVVIRDQGTQHFLEEVTNRDEYWIGLSDVRESEEFVWSDGSPITDFSSWMAGEPSHQTTGWDWLSIWKEDENCVSMSPLWNDKTCDTELPYICQKAPDIHVRKKVSKPDVDTLLSIIQQQEDRLVSQQDTMLELEDTISHTEQELDSAQYDLDRQNRLVQQLMANISTQRESFLDVIEMEKEEIAAQCTNTIANLTSILEQLYLPDTSTAQPQDKTTQQPQPTGFPTKETTIQLGCSPDYLEFGTKCYRLGKRELEYRRANSRCRAEGGQLLTWKDSHGSLEKLVHTLQTQNDMPEIYKIWVDSTALREHTGMSRRCWLHFVQSSKNFEAECDKMKNFICEKELEAVQSQTTEMIPTAQVTKRLTTQKMTERIPTVQATERPPTPQPTKKVTTEMVEQLSCDSDYILFEDMCYKPFKDPLSNQEAKHVCQNDGGNLLQANDDSDWTEAMNRARQQLTGIHLPQDIWVDTVRPSHYNPAGSYMEDVCWLRFTYKNYSEPWDCNSFHHFICEKAPVVVDSLSPTVQVTVGPQTEPQQTTLGYLSPECPAHSSWTDCGSACPVSCDTLGSFMMCPEICTPGCQCDDGYVLNGSDCIPKEQCNKNGCNYNGNHYDDGETWADESPGHNCECAQSQPICLVVDCAPGYQHVIGADGIWSCQQISYLSPDCPAHSSWTDCGSACPVSCDTLGSNMICPAACTPGCQCDDGYVLDGSDCIPKEQCSKNGCNYNGNHYDDGETWADESPGHNCECAQSQPICLVVDCAPGYQHVIGADGIWSCQQIRFSGSYEYTGLGCWRDRRVRAMTMLEGTDPRLDDNFWTRINPIEKCYQVARSRGFPVFAVQAGGQCFGSADGLNTYNKYGPSPACQEDGEGGHWANEVYQITDTGTTASPTTQAPKLEPVTEMASVLQCTPGYELFQDNCYKAFDVEEDYHRSEAVCEDDGGMLAMPQDQAIDNFLINLRSALNPYVRYWIGLSDREKEGTWIWADGQPLTFSSWAIGEPNSAGDEDCVVYAAHPTVRDKWNDIPCNLPYRFICQKPAMVVADKSTTETPVAEPTSPPSCPTSYSEFKGRCYSLSPMRASQGRAAHTCGEQGGQLVVHDDDPEWTQFLTAEIDFLNTEAFHFQYWQDKPEDLGTLAMIKFKVEFGDLADACWARNPFQDTTLPVDCFTQLNFICEQEMVIGADDQELTSTEGAITTANKVTVKPIKQTAPPAGTMEEPELGTGDPALADLQGEIKNDNIAEDPAPSDPKQEADQETGDTVMKNLLSKLKGKK